MQHCIILYAGRGRNATNGPLQHSLTYFEGDAGLDLGSFKPRMCAALTVLNIFPKSLDHTLRKLWKLLVLMRWATRDLGTLDRLGNSSVVPQD